MRILMLAQFFPPDVGGEERHVLNLSTVLASRGHEVSVATQARPGEESEQTLDSGIRVYRLPTTAGRFAQLFTDPGRRHHPPCPDPRLTRALSHLVDRERPEIVHAHNWIVNSAVALRRAGSTRDRFALVLTLHDYSDVCATKRLMYRDLVVCPGPGATRCLVCACGHYGPLVGMGTAAAVPLMRWWKARALDATVCVSQAVADGNRVHRLGVPHCVVPNFIPDHLVDAPWPRLDPEVWRAAGAPPDGFILFFGDLTRDKGVPFLVEAYRELASAPSAGQTLPPLLLVGRVSPDTPSDLPEGATVAEMWPHHLILEALRRASIVALPPTWPDPCPTTVLEAMAAGRPVVTTAMGGVVDMVGDGVSGLLVEPGSSTDLARGLRRLVEDSELRRRLSAGARERVGAFTATAVARRLELLYAAAHERARSR